MESITNVDELINVIRNKNIYIWGTGFVGERFYRGLLERQLSNNVQGFVVSQTVEDEFYGKTMISIEKLSQEFDKENDYICIAVHEAISEQIEKALKTYGIHEYTWIYPFFHEICFGKPVRRNVKKSVKELLIRYLDDYAIAIRYLAIEQFYEKNNYGYDVYKKGMQLHCDKETAVKRLEKFISLMQQWDINGYDENSHIKVTEEGHIFDGVHRLSLAYYYNRSHMICDVYHVKDYSTFINQNVRITEQQLAMFEKKEINEISSASEKIRQFVLN